MRYLTTALIAEGVSDDRFLPGLLGRALVELCLAEFDGEVEVPDVQPLRCRQGPAPIDEVIGLVERNAGSFLVVFFHHDQGANAERVEREWLAPLRARWGDRRERLVAVVPVRETEAWLLADGDALRAALGVRWTDQEMALPGTPQDVESIPDPKRVLKQVMDRVGRSPRDHYAQLAELVSIDRLTGVPAFRRWWDETRDALTEIGFRRI